MAITVDNVADHLIATLRELGWLHWSQIAQALTDYEMMQHMLKEDKLIIDSGSGIKRTLMDKTIGAARHKGAYDEDQGNIGDHLVELDVPWRHADTTWQVHFVHDVLMNSGKQMVNNVIMPRRAGAMIDLAAELEDKCWAAPAVGNDTEPYGIPYWLVKNATTGFNGGYPGSHTDIAGINLTNHPNFKNYTFKYTGVVTEADALRLMRAAHLAIRFKSPIGVPEFRGAKGQRYRIYVNDETYLQMEDVAMQRNDNLGTNLAAISSVDGVPTFKKHPIVNVPKLNADTQYPIYMLDRATIYPVVLEGDHLRETVREIPNKHNLTRTITELTYNFLCTDRRQNAVGYK